MKHLISYFAGRPVVANVVLFGIILSSVVFWKQIGKEEMPEFAMESVRVSVRYPGASAEDVELFITKPIEEKLKGITGLEEVTSSSSYGNGSLFVSFEPRMPNLQEKIQEVKDAVDSADLPREADEPTYRQFRSSEKAIIDIGMYLEDIELLTPADRSKLQKYVLAFKDKILSLPEISGVETQGYLRPELQIQIKPERLKQYEISMNQVRNQITEKHVRRPIGNLEDRGESDVTIVSELDSVSSLEQVIISSGFEGQKIRLSQMASVEQSFEKSTTVRKINGHEGIILNIQKSSNTDILTAQKAVIGFVDRFSKQNGQARMKVVLMDDESFDVRNRLSIIGTNGAIGFILIVFILFFFLDFRSGVWVAMGIPFSLAFTLMFAFVIGYTINNMTLAAIIVVLGIVVDDAIIVAENIIRNLKGNSKESAVASTARVFSPIVASILTTCAAFIPLYFFSGRFGLFVKYLPAIIFCMLAASLIESIFILPSHMAHKMKIEIWLEQFEFPKKFGKFRENFIHVIENIYIQTVVRILNFRTLVISCFLILILASAYIFSTKLKYVMFPREESKDFRVKVVVPEGSTRLETAKSVRKIEDIFNSNKYVVGTITTIGQSRRGGEVRENEASLRVEVVPPDERDLTLNAMFSEWEKTFETFKEYKQIKLYKSRWGSDSGSAIAIEIQESDDQHRNLIAERLKTQLDKLPYLSEVEIERPISKNEYRLEIKTNDASQVGVNFNQLSSVLRAYVEGDILYTLNSGVEEVDVRLTSLNAAKESIDELTNLTVANNSNYLVPIKNIVQVVKGKKPSNIQRVNFKRTTMVYADLKSEAKITPLEIADYLENKIFHQVTEGIPSANIVFRGEIEDSRESQSEFTLSIILVISLIFVLLVFLYDSVWSPLLIAAIIPFGLIGSIFAFWLHGMNQYGFFAVVGALGMIGVVVNDSIVLVDILNEAFKDKVNNFNQLIVRIAEVTSTRLRAVVVTTLTTVAGIIPTAYGFGGYDSMLSEMMLAMGWGLLFGMFVTLLLVPCLYSFYAQLRALKSGDSQ